MRVSPPLLCALLFVTACGARTRLETPPPADAGAPLDATFDAGLDASSDAGVDAPIDVGPPPPDAPSCVRDDDCDDGIACTRDLCEDRRCRALPDHAACDDDLFCTGVEQCVPGVGCVADPPDCRDAVECTVDVCDETLDRCVRDPDADLCPISHRCDPVGGCIARALAHDATRLFEIDLPSGAMHELGVTPVTLTDIALHPDGTLYGAVSDALVRVDYEAGTIERIVEVAGPFVGLDISPDGELFGSIDQRVVRFDLARGTAVRVATYPGGLRASGDLAFVEGRLYATVMGGRGGDWLVEVPLGSGARPRIVGATGQECIWGLAPFGPTLYGLTCGGALLEIDVATAGARRLATPNVMFYGAGAR